VNDRIAHLEMGNDLSGRDLGPQAWIVKPDHGPPMPRDFRKVQGADTLNKPGVHLKPPERRGLWTSTWTGPESISEWAEWCMAEDFAGPEWRVYVLTPRPRTKLWNIDSLDDLIALLDRFGAETELSRAVGRTSMFPGIDFDAFLRDGYIGVHLTDKGQWATRLSEPSLYGWDCEWAFAEVEDMGVLTHSHKCGRCNFSFEEEAE
jgi:hypothetical protein